MSVIFSHALNALKLNPSAQAKAQKQALISKTADNSKSILTRIKKTPKISNKLQLESKSAPEDKNQSVMRVSHKLIKKPKSSIILRTKTSTQTPTTTEWTHDLYEGPGPSLTNRYHTVFIRNLPDVIDSEILKKNILDKHREFVTGVKIEKDTAEINFSEEEAAKKSSENLNGKIIAGKKIKAALISETNPKNLTIGIRKKSKGNAIETEGDEKENFDRKMNIDFEEKKKSIMDRIKKNH